MPTIGSCEHVVPILPGWTSEKALLLAACGGVSEPLPDIDATVEARVAEQGAIQDYDEAIRLNPQLGLAYHNMGA